MKALIEKAGGRKMLIWWVLLSVSLVVYFGTMIGSHFVSDIKQVEFSDWSSFIMWVTGIVVAGNVGEHTAKRSQVD